jgi:hypothetical protein
MSGLRRAALIVGLLASVAVAAPVSAVQPFTEPLFE